METSTSTDGTTLAFDRHGDGPALVLVAGATAHRAISPNIPALAAHIGGTPTTGAGAATAATRPRTPPSARSRTSPR